LKKNGFGLRPLQRLRLTPATVELLILKPKLQTNRAFTCIG